MSVVTELLDILPGHLHGSRSRKKSKLTQNRVQGMDMQLYDVITHPWGRLNKKDGLTRYGDSHVKDKTS